MQGLACISLFYQTMLAEQRDNSGITAKYQRQIAINSNRISGKFATVFYDSCGLFLYKIGTEFSVINIPQYNQNRHSNYAEIADHTRRAPPIGFVRNTECEYAAPVRPEGLRDAAGRIA